VNVQTAHGTTWTGELLLELRNARDWSVGDAELSVRRETVIVHHADRSLAVMDRDLFRDWLHQSDPAPLDVDDVVWSVQLGMTFMSVGPASFRQVEGRAAQFRVTPESLANLVLVI
jgi:hypothetical protein